MSYTPDADDLPVTPRRRARRDAHTDFRGDRRDPNAPIIQLITRDTAACAAESNPDRWFPGAGGSGRPDAGLRVELRRICLHCPLLQPCLDYALRTDVKGIWAGTNEAERKRLRAQRRITPERVGFFAYLPRAE